MYAERITAPDVATAITQQMAYAPSAKAVLDRLRESFISLTKRGDFTITTLRSPFTVFFGFMLDTRTEEEKRLRSKSKTNTARRDKFDGKAASKNGVGMFVPITKSGFKAPTTTVAHVDATAARAGGPVPSVAPPVARMAMSGVAAWVLRVAMLPSWWESAKNLRAKKTEAEWERLETNE